MLQSHPASHKNQNFIATRTHSKTPQHCHHIFPICTPPARLQRGKPPCSTTRHSDASASATDVAAGTTPSISWYTDYHGVVQRLERLYKQRVGRAVVEDCLPDELGVALLGVQLNDQPSTSASTAGSGRTGGGGGNGGKDEDFYVNAGVAIRTLRDDIPNLFQEDLDCTYMWGGVHVGFCGVYTIQQMHMYMNPCTPMRTRTTTPFNKHLSRTDDIYREDIVFRDPRNVFRGIKNYRTIFWSLRFHGRIFFRHLYVEILSIWQPGDKQIKMRWKVHGIPRVPWETEGTFDGISTFKLDSHGKVYEHQVDNVIFRDNPPLRLPIFARINLVPGAVSNGGQPCPGMWVCFCCMCGCVFVVGVLLVYVLCTPSFCQTPQNT